MNWKKLKEEKPEELVLLILANDKYDLVTPGILFRGKFYGTGEDDWVGDPEREITWVTHWMYFPKAPKEE